MRYWKRFKDGEETVLRYVEADEVSYLLDKMNEMHIRKENLNEKYYKSKMTELLERLRKEIEG